jgi:GntR family transcriptional regulator, arabinose operon transcriptional repressor
MTSSSPSTASTVISENVPRHRAVYQTILGRIKDGEYQTGCKLPSHGELTREFQVSRPTVIRALLDLCKEGYIKSRKGSGNFVTSSTAGKLKVGLIVPGVLHHESESIFPDIIRQITYEAERIGWEIVRASSSLPNEDNDLNRPVELARQMIASGIRAAILTPLPVDGRGDAFNRNVLSEFSAAGVTIILLDRDIVDHFKRSDFDLIAMDSIHAGYTIGKHLSKRGCKRPLFVSCTPHVMNQHLRFHGLCQAYEKSKYSPIFVRAEQSFDAKFIKELVELHNPDAFIGDYDRTASVILACLRRLKYKVPEDIKVAGFDDSPMSKLPPVPLTTIAQPVEALAFKAIETLRDRLDRKDLSTCTVMLQGKLIPRISTGK